MKYKFEHGQYFSVSGQGDDPKNEDVNVLTLVKTLKYSEKPKPFLVKIINVDDDFVHIEPYVDQHVVPHTDSKVESKS